MTCFPRMNQPTVISYQGYNLEDNNSNDQRYLDLYNISDENLNEELVWAIQCREYKMIRELLSKNTFDPNTEVNFGCVYMTALEYAVFTCDWKMAILFFVYGADPHVECFDGNTYFAQTHNNDETTSSEGKVTFPNGNQSIIGFERLRSIVPKNFSVTDIDSFTKLHDCLWLMEIAHGDTSVCTQRDTPSIWRIMKQIASEVESSINLSQESATVFSVCMINVEVFYHNRSTENNERDNFDIKKGTNFNSEQDSQLFDVITCVLRSVAKIL